jgi:hypothetical protein
MVEISWLAARLPRPGIPHETAVPAESEGTDCHQIGMFFIGNNTVA